MKTKQYKYSNGIRQAYYIFLVCATIFATPALADPTSNRAPLNITETDGSPSTYPYKLKVTNGTLTDNGDGTASLATGGAGGSAAGGTSAVQYNSGSSTFAGDETKFSFDGTGNVGIGSATPNALLNLSSTANINLLRVDDNGPGDSTPTIIDKSGNIGIGTASITDGYKIMALTTASDTGSSYDFEARSDATSFVPRFQMTKATAANGNLSNGNAIGSFDFNAKYNSVSNTVGRVEGLYTGDGTTQVGDIRFLTSNSGSVSEGARLTGAGNLGIGTAVPGQVLDVAGNQRIRGTNSTFYGDDNKASISASATTTPDIRFLTNSAEVMRVTNGGNVGIGTTTPQAAFVVTNGNVGIGTWTATNPLYIAVNGVGENGITVNSGSGSAAVDVQTSTASKVAEFRFLDSGTLKGALGIDRGTTLATNAARNDIVLYTASGAGTKIHLATEGAQRLTVDSTGNIGIGTFTPQVKLAILGPVGIGTWTAPSASTGLTVMNGFVGIGTFVPRSLLALKGSGYPELAVESSNSNGGTLSLRSSTKVWELYVEGNDLNLAAENGSANKITVQAGGNVGINTITPGQLLDVTGNARLTGTSQLFLGNDNLAGFLASATTTPDIKFMANSAEVMRVTNSGNVGVGTTLPSTLLEVGARKFNIQSGGNVGIGSVDPSATLDVNGAGRFAASGNSYFMSNVGIGTTVPFMNLAILGNVGIGTLSNSLYLNTQPPNGGMIIQGNVGIGTWVVGGKLAVGIGTTVPQQICRKTDGTFGYFDGAWASVCN